MNLNLCTNQRLTPNVSSNKMKNIDKWACKTGSLHNSGIIKTSIIYEIRETNHVFSNTGKNSGIRGRQGGC